MKSRKTPTAGRLLCVVFALVLAPSKGFSGGDPYTGLERDRLFSALTSDSTLWPLVTIEVPSEDNITVYDDYLAFHLFRGQEPLFGGIRSEIAIHYFFQEHDTVIYQWEVMIPSDFQSDTPANRWWDIGQWHDQPDITLGETWEDFPGQSPPVSLHLKYYNGIFYFAPRYMHTEPPDEDLIQIQPGQWTKLRFQIRWSREDDGYMKIWVDDESEPCVYYTGPNMNNGYSHTLKLGMYRHPDIDTDNTVNIRNVQIYHAEGQSSYRSVRTP